MTDPWRRRMVVISGEALAWMVVALALWLGYHGDWIAPPPADPPSRLAFMAGWFLLPWSTVVLGILLVQYERFTTEAIDPLSGHERDNRRMQVFQRNLQNTLEQTVIYAGAHAAFAVAAPAEQVVLEPVFAAIFVLGRVVFVLGYLRDSLWRAPGYGLTFYPTVLVGLYAGYLLAA